LDELLAFAGVTIVDLSDTYDSAERVDKVAPMLDQILKYFQFQEDLDSLRLLIIVEECPCDHTGSSSYRRIDHRISEEAEHTNDGFCQSFGKGTGVLPNRQVTRIKFSRFRGLMASK